MGKLIDNSKYLMMLDQLKKEISNTKYHTIKIATGYWDIPGLTLVVRELRSFLEREDSKVLQLLIGTDPIVRIEQQKKAQFTNGQFPEDYIKRNIADLEVKEKYVESVKLLQQYCKEDEETSKIQIRIYRTDEDGDAQFLHAKCYVFTGETTSCGIIGSSNFTAKGLQDNAELNYLDKDPKAVTSKPIPGNPEKGHICWFDEKWNISKPWNRIFLEEVLRPSDIGKEVKKELERLTPYEVYIKYLQMLFGDLVDPSADGLLKSYLPKDFKILQYQLDAVKQCFYFMKQHNGFMLADVVGLGKTVVGVLIIKKFLNEAAVYNKPSKVLIVTPPAIKEAWVEMIADFDKGSNEKISSWVSFVTTGSISSIPENDTNEDDDDDPNFTYNDYGLILVDESHNFRNNTTNKYQALDGLIGKIIADTGKQPFVGLLSATPMNNRPKDIQNQIYLFERTPNASTFSSVPNGKLDTFFSNMSKIYEEHKRTSSEPKSKEALTFMSKQIKEFVLDHILVRRTRTDIKKLYPDDSKDLHFPSISGPHKLEYIMDEDLARLFYDTVEKINPTDNNDEDAIRFFRYCAIMYFKDEKLKELYEKGNLTVESISRRLQSMMKLLLVKRLESSKSAFKISLGELKRNTQNMISMLEHDCVFICPKIDVNLEFKKADYNFEKAAESIRIKIKKKGGENREFRASDFKPEYLLNLREDLVKINRLYERWSENDDDPKLDRFIKAIDNELFNTETNTSRKLIIFTESVDTQKAIASKIKNKYRVLTVSADNRDRLYRTIVANFDANAKEKKNDYDILVTTEVLAEGVNLHRANVILNYDTPWNATRLMQRIGRVNRIGSTAKVVYVYNFFPTTQSNEILHLIQNAYSKLQSFHIMFGEDSKVFIEDEEIPESDLKRWTDGDESEIARFVKELRDYHKNNPGRYEYIRQAEFRNLGGTVITLPEYTSLVLVHAPAIGFVPISVVNGNARIVSNLEFMSLLKCPADAQYSAPSPQTGEIIKLAMKCYNNSVSRSTLARSESKNAKKAMDIIQRLRGKSLSDESIICLNDAIKAVRAKNKDVINAVLRLEDETMFDADFNINSWISGALSHVSKRNIADFGEPAVALKLISEK